MINRAKSPISLSQDSLQPGGIVEALSRVLAQHFSAEHVKTSSGTFLLSESVASLNKQISTILEVDIWTYQVGRLVIVNNLGSSYVQMRLKWYVQIVCALMTVRMHKNAETRSCGL